MTALPTQPPTEFDVVVFGASGFTGRLICERLAERGPEKGLRWAMAGRNEEKLAAVRKAVGAENAAGLIVADSDDLASLTAMAARTRVVIAAAGPFQLYGSGVVEACIANGTDYLDLSGEVVWMRQMIDAHAEAAERGGARILFSCGFDSVPFELGVVFLQSTAISRFGTPVLRAKGRVRRMVGRFSGGTAASGRATRATAKREPEVAKLLQDPFCLTPGFEGPAQPDLNQVAFDDDLGTWTAPFVMAPINSRNIHRSNALQGHRWGTDFHYDEALVVGPGIEGEARARAVAAGNPLGADADLQPGEGPSRAERDAGWYDLLFIGRSPDGRQIRVAVTGDRDPGYGSTARIIVETALCLRDKGDAVPPGIWTPGAALGLDLVDALQRHAGLTFRTEEAPL
jgi:short subunit dehydrogenase-like uncharacterized protein